MIYQRVSLVQKIIAIAFLSILSSFKRQFRKYHSNEAEVNNLFLEDIALTPNNTNMQTPDTTLRQTSEIGMQKMDKQYFEGLLSKNIASIYADSNIPRNVVQHAIFNFF